MKMGGYISYGLILSLKDAKAIALEWCTVRNCYIEDKEFNPEYAKNGDDVSALLGVKVMDDTIKDFQNKENQTKIPLTRFQRFMKKHFYKAWKFFYKNKDKNSSEFPGFAISKSDETRIESLSFMFGDDFQGKKVYSTVKMDGQSFTAAIHKGKFYVASRNITKYCQPLKKAIKELVPSNIDKLGRFDDFVKIACKLSIAKKMSYFQDYSYLLGNDFAIQGELCGPGKQKNHMGLAEDELYLFNLYDSCKQRYFRWFYLEYFAKEMGFRTVPFIERFEWRFRSIQEIKAYAKGTYPNGYPREGVVIRSNESVMDGPDKFDRYNGLFIEGPVGKQHGSFSLKCINDDFAIKDA
jgi:hypothetical protein